MRSVDGSVEQRRRDLKEKGILIYTYDLSIVLKRVTVVQGAVYCKLVVFLD